MTYIIKGEHVFYFCDHSTCDETVTRKDFVSTGWRTVTAVTDPKHACPAHEKLWNKK